MTRMYSKIAETEHPAASGPTALQPSAIPVNEPSSQFKTEPSIGRLTSRPWKYPLPKLRLHVENASHESIAHILQHFNITELLEESVRTVLKLLYPAISGNSDPFCCSKQRPWPEVRSITLKLLEHPGVAETSGTALDDAHKEVKLNLDYVRDVWQKFVKPDEKAGEESQSRPVPVKGIEKFKHEIRGVIVHEFVHCYQWSGRDNESSVQSQPNSSNAHAPGGLIEGIADWVRLKAGLGALHWKPPSKSNPVDYTWDVGYERTAFFLTWLEDVYGSYSVTRINASLRKAYEADVFWSTLFGKTVHELWHDYKKQVETKTLQDQN